MLRVCGREGGGFASCNATHTSANHQSAFSLRLLSLSPLSPSIPTFILHFHSFLIHFHIADWREREPFIFTPNQTRFVPIFPFFLFLFSIISTPQSPHFPPLSLLSFFPSFLPSLFFPQMASSSAPCDHSGQQPIEIGCAHTICANCGIVNETNNTI